MGKVENLSESREIFTEKRQPKFKLTNHLPRNLKLQQVSYEKTVFADDIVIFGRNRVEPRKLLAALKKYFYKNSFQVITDKSVILVCRTSGRIKKQEQNAFTPKGGNAKNNVRLALAATKSILEKSTADL
ncbi:hypothetical protein KQX54_013986 [Cotesia glomerata]|uniref:Reverse transcriptase n=1 Tax=Cotesia glomerata TaxID=32391 RepID=A0AAV7HTD9_COTGL|nr:hypothetical protein KQX54_013986 [Cotesia glomerata]